MDFTFTGAVDASFPNDTHRPVFLLTGIAVTWSAAPTTAEEMVLALDRQDGADTAIRRYDPSTGSATEWIHIITDGPIPLDRKTKAKVSYPNTDARTINLSILGRWEE